MGRRRRGLHVRLRLRLRVRVRVMQPQPQLTRKLMVGSPWTSIWKQTEPTLWCKVLASAQAGSGAADQPSLIRWEGCCRRRRRGSKQG